MALVKRRRAHGPTVSILSLPNDAVWCITPFLHMENIMRLSQTCRQLHEQCGPDATPAWVRCVELSFTNPAVYPSTYFRRLSATQVLGTRCLRLPLLCTFAPQLRELYLHDSMVDNVSCLAKLPHLHTLTLNAVHIRDFGKSLGDVQQLKHLTIKHCFRGYLSLEFVSSLPNLESLQLQDHILAPRSRRGLTKRFRKLVSLKRLKVCAVHGFSDEMWVRVTQKKYLPNLVAEKCFFTPYVR